MIIDNLCDCMLTTDLERLSPQLCICIIPGCEDQSWEKSGIVCDLKCSVMREVEKWEVGEDKEVCIWWLLCSDISM